MYNYNSLSMFNGEKEKELYIFKKDVYIVIQKVINFSIIENNKPQSELKNAKNAQESYPTNNGIFNFEKFLGEACNSYPEKNNKIQKIIDDMQRSSISNNPSKNNYNLKFKYFGTKKNLIEKNIVDLQSNNEIKVLKIIK